MALFPRMTLTEAVVGAVATVVAVKIARPLMVEVVRAGFKVKDLAEEGYGKAKSEIDKVKADARASRSESGVSAEIARLQAQVASLQSQLASKKA